MAITEVSLDQFPALMLEVDEQHSSPDALTELMRIEEEHGKSIIQILWEQRELLRDDIPRGRTHKGH